MARSKLLVRVHSRGIQSGFKRSLGMAPAPNGWDLLTSFLPGVSLDRAQRSRFSEAPRLIGELGIALLDRLEVLHGRGIVHGRLAPRHVILGDDLGLTGLGEPGDASPDGDLLAVGSVLYELATRRPMGPGYRCVALLCPELGSSLDEWLQELLGGGFADAADARSWLRATTAVLPSQADPRPRKHSGMRESVRAPVAGRSESLDPPPSDMLSRIA